MKIRAKSGEIIDLAILRANLDGGVPWATAVLDALEAALSLNHPPIGTNAMLAAWMFGWNTAKNDMRQAAGVIEEPA